VTATPLVTLAGITAKGFAQVEVKCPTDGASIAYTSDKNAAN